MGGSVRAVAITGQQDRAEGQGVPRPFVMEAVGQLVDREAVLGEPAHVVGHLGLAFRMAEATRHELRAVDDAGVGGEDEVGQARVGFEQLDFGAGAAKGCDQPVPLGARTVDVDLDLAVHPGVDLVEHAEVLRRAHEETAAPGEGHRVDFNRDVERACRGRGRRR